MGLGDLDAFRTLLEHGCDLEHYDPKNVRSKPMALLLKRFGIDL